MLSLAINKRDETAQRFMLDFDESIEISSEIARRHLM